MLTRKCIKFFLKFPNIMNRILVHIAKCTLRRLNELIIRGSVLIRRMIAKYSNRKINYKIKKSLS